MVEPLSDISNGRYYEVNPILQIKCVLTSDLCISTLNHGPSLFRPMMMK